MKVEAYMMLYNYWIVTNEFLVMGAKFNAESWAFCHTPLEKA